jgi:hypothetical protein
LDGNTANFIYGRAVRAYKSDSRLRDGLTERREDAPEFGADCIDFGDHARRLVNRSREIGPGRQPATRDFSGEIAGGARACVADVEGVKVSAKYFDELLPFVAGHVIPPASAAARAQPAKLHFSTIDAEAVESRAPVDPDIDGIEIDIPYVTARAADEVMMVVRIDFEVHRSAGTLKGADQAGANQLLQVAVHGGV